LYSKLTRRVGARKQVVVPNDLSIDSANDAGVTNFARFARPTESFARKNLNSTFDDQFAMFDPVVTRARDEGMAVRGYLSMCFGDPWEGAVAPDQVVAAGKRLLDAGCWQLALGDTIGVATPGQ